MNAAYAVLDLETSGFCAATDAILEIAVVHWSPGDQPRLAFETLIDSQGRFGLEELHGIRREDLHAAPTFGEIAGDLWNACAGRVVVGHNVEACDLPFLANAYHRLGARFAPPGLCTMALDRHLRGGGKNRSLDAVASEICLGRRGSRHVAADDAVITAWVLEHQLERLGPAGLPELARPLLGPIATAGQSRRRARSGLSGLLDRKLFAGGDGAPVGDATTLYWQGLLTAMADCQVDLAELAVLRTLRQDVPEQQARAVHASVLATLLAGCAINGRVDDDEAETIDHAMRILGMLGWVPGQEPASGRRERDP